MSFTPSFGWAPRYDERSRAYAVSAGDKPLRSYTWDCPITLDQGQEGACVGFAYTHALAARPRQYRSGMTDWFSRQVYREAQRFDYWEGEDYEGTSVLAGAKITKREGYLTEYRWAFNTNDALWAIGYRGPLIIGINWYTGMVEPDSEGMLHKTGVIEGGHALAVNGISVPDEVVRVHNSWGPTWGQGGEAFLSFEDFDALLREQGEFCIPVKTPVRKR